jgi:hypothetical protein
MASRRRGRSCPPTSGQPAVGAGLSPAFTNLEAPPTPDGRPSPDGQSLTISISANSFVPTISSIHACTAPVSVR